MKRALLLLAAAGLPALATAQVSLGRLFSTPAEREAMEATRGSSAALAPNSAGQQPAPGMPGGPAAAPTPGGAPADAAPAAPTALVMSGILRRSDNRTTVWLNDQPQAGVQGSMAKRGAAAPGLTVTLPSGQKIRLKAGQRYDLNQGRIKDVNEE